MLLFVSLKVNLKLEAWNTITLRSLSFYKCENVSPNDYFYYQQQFTNTNEVLLQISIATFKLGQVEVLQQSRGFQSAVKVQVSKFSSDECCSIPWDEFQVSIFNTDIVIDCMIYS